MPKDKMVEIIKITDNLRKELDSNLDDEEEMLEAYLSKLENNI